MLFVVTACAGENERRSQERAADIGGKQNHSFIESVELCLVMLFVVTACAGENERSRERTADLGSKQYHSFTESVELHPACYAICCNCVCR